ncbi:hypothetical protein CDL12_19830 [Handroanthus impetiginosus]|uniref:Uncharacterized protein n=1 Tax=Handroanthus impetiginosus TaxID=429701 RepID=A0A2G9GQL6_9LAMI|nr:hypothetical protein CDL12_19830 [Handroanthus impetiginosus]
MFYFSNNKIRSQIAQSSGFNTILNSLATLVPLNLLRLIFCHIYTINAFEKKKRKNLLAIILEKVSSVSSKSHHVIPNFHSDTSKNTEAHEAHTKT